MAPAVQAKMLRVLQEQRFQPLGSNQSVRTDVRILAATNHDLEKDVAEGKFRKDLYYRLKVISIAVPALRERREDIPELAHHFLFAFNRELHREYHGFSPDALALLQEYDWPGNVRELQGAIKEAMLLGTGHLILPEFFPAALHRKAASSPLPADHLDLNAVVRDLL